MCLLLFILYIIYNEKGMIKLDNRNILKVIKGAVMI